MWEIARPYKWHLLLSIILFFVITGMNMIGHVHLEGYVATLMAAATNTVDINGRDIIHRSEMEEDPALGKALGKGEIPAVFQIDAVGGRDAQPRQKGLGTEGDEDGLGFTAVYGDLPFSVEAEEGIPLHLRAGVHVPRDGSGGVLQRLSLRGQEVDDGFGLTHGKPPWRSFSS